MKLNLTIPTIFTILSGSISISSYYFFKYESFSKNNTFSQINYLDIEKSSIVAEHVRDNKNGTRFCFIWTSNGEGRKNLLESECEKLSNEIPNISKYKKGKTIQKIRAKEDYIDRVLDWNNLSRKNKLIRKGRDGSSELWVPDGGWNCISKKIKSSKKDWKSEILVNCILFD